MAGPMHLEPERAQRIQYLAKGFMEEEFIPVIKDVFDTAAMLGNNPVVEGIQGKCTSIQRLYNEQCTPVIDAFLSELGKATDLFDMLASTVADTTVTAQVTGEIKTGQFDAAMDL